MDIKIIIAAHKPYVMPTDDIYIPLQVGAAGKSSISDVHDSYTRDDTGDNISDKNASYCELTGLYWAWKNLQCDYLGLAHYRRHFTVAHHIPKNADKMQYVLTGEQAEKLLQEADIIVPKKRNYYIETLYSHYAHTHDATHLDITREIIGEKCPQYLGCYDAVINSRGGHMFNMFLMKKSDVDDYCQWLFDILGELEQRVDASELSAFQGRLYGRVSEILFNVWLQSKVQQGSSVKAIGCMHMEPINWWKKGTAFLKAKFTGRKYGGSF